MLIRSGDIRDQIRKLPKIAPNFGQFFAVTNYHPCLAGCRLKKSREDTPTSPEVIDLKTLNLRPNFKFSRLIFFGGGIPSHLGVCATKAWSISSTCKNFRAQHPLRAKMLSPEKSPLGCKFIKLNNFFVCGPKYTNFFV